MRICATCGAKLADTGPEGLCPKCFLEEGLAERRDAEPLSVGLVPFGDYELLGIIARGGMGVVYRARQVSLDRVVAVKMMLAGPWAGADFARRFQAEARSAASLQHPNIVAIHEIGEHDGQPFFSMDFVDGPNLADLTRGHPLPARRAAACLKSVAGAVQFAHQHGVLHRDLKPSNILIDPFDQPRITDFGLAKRFPAALSAPTGPASAAAATTGAVIEDDLTLTGQVLGSPSYLPPEQAEGRADAGSPTSDVYGLGAVLYHLLTGRPPFQAGTVKDVLHQVSHADPVPPQALNPSVPKDLETICLKCLRKEPGRRYTTAQALAEELDRFLRGEPILARPVNRLEKAVRWCQRRPVLAGLTAALLVVFLLGLAGVLWQWRRAESERQLQRLYAYTSDMKAAQAALDQDNRGMAMSLLRRHFPRAGEPELRGLEWRFLWQLARGDEWRTFPHPAMVHSAALSPEGSLLATMGHDARVRVWEIATGRQVREFASEWTMTPYQSVAFSPDGKWLAATGRRGVELRDTTRWEVERQLPGACGPLSFSGDSRRLAVMGATAVQVWDLAEGRVQEFGGFATRHCSLTFTPDGRQLATALAVPAFDIDGPIVLHDLATRTNETLPASTSTVSVRISADGRWLAAGTWQGEVGLWDLPARRLERRIQAHQGMVLGLAFAPDSRSLASGGNDQAIHIWEVPSLNRRRTLHGHVNEIHELAFDAKGELLVSASTDGLALLWKPDAISPRSSTWSLPANTAPLGPLPDGSAFVAVDGLAGQTQLRNPTNGTLIRSWSWAEFARRGCQRAQFFLSSETVAAHSTNGGLHFWSLRTGEYQGAGKIADVDFNPWRLSPDHRWLVGTMSNLWLFDLRDGHPPVSLPDSFSSSATFSPDGRWLAYGGCPPDYRTTIWDLAASQVAVKLGSHRWYARAARFSPDSRLLATGAMDGEVRLWSVPDGRPLHPPLKGHQSRVGVVLFSPDGRTLITSGEDRTLRWWNVATGREMLRLADARIPSNFRELYNGFLSVETQWNPGGKLLAWLDGAGRIHSVPLPSLAEIDAMEQRRPLLP
ncbi:MAG TPA: serine/threonine-protein kinase [Verrucomicrobiae bacterium]